MADSLRCANPKRRPAEHPVSTRWTPLSEITIAERLARHTTACIGKWHLSVNLGTLHPNQCAIDWYSGFLGDNGTTPSASTAPCLPSHAKSTLYEGGVNVPLIVRGPNVAQGACAGLVFVVDLFATIAELGLSPAPRGDSVSMVPYFTQPTLSIRPSVYTETFSPNGAAPPFPSHSRAVRNARYKLIRRTGQGDQFFDLQVDPFEMTNLLLGLSASEQIEYDALIAQLVALGVR